MKRKISFLIGLFFTAAGVFHACNEEGKTKLHNEASNPDNVAGQVPGNSPATTEMGVEEMLSENNMVFKDTVSQAFRDKFSQVVNAYLTMKDGFDADNWKQIDQ